MDVKESGTQQPCFTDAVNYLGPECTMRPELAKMVLTPTKAIPGAKALRQAETSY